MNDSSVDFRARGMHCHGCEHIIEVSVRKLPGVRDVKADYPTERVTVAFDPASTSFEDIRAAVEQQGYRVVALQETEKRGLFATLGGVAIGVAGILLIIFFDTRWISETGAPDIARHMSLDLIFLLGLLTGFHCVGMCGGFVLSYTADDARLGRRSYRSHILYGAGKTLSYTAIGALFGLLGAIVAFTPMLRGVAGMTAGAFLIAFGLNMLGLFAPLRRLRLGLPASLHRYIDQRTHHSHRPLVIGLANGLMIACGPLQAMYVMAAGTGSALEGAKMLFAFGVGSLPVLMSFGVFATLVSASLTHRLLKASGAIVVVLGAVMINRGLILTGSGYDLQSVVSALTRKDEAPPRPVAREEQQARPASSQPQQEDARPPAPPPPPRPAFQTITMNVARSGYAPNRFVLARAVPVRWVVDGKQITSCNNRIVVPSLNLEFDVKKGRQVIEFTPEKTGVIRWSCWMGMLHGAFDVVDELPERSAQDVQIAEPTYAAEPGSAASPAAHDVYTIVLGDTLGRIAARLYHDARRSQDILDANPGLDSRRLRPGQAIRLPTAIGAREP